MTFRDEQVQFEGNVSLNGARLKDVGIVDFNNESIDPSIGEMKRVNGLLKYGVSTGAITLINESTGKIPGSIIDLSVEGGPTNIGAGAGLQKIGNTIDIVSDNVAITINPDSIALTIEESSGLEIGLLGLKTNYIYFELNGSTDETVTHNFGRIANVKVYENNEEIEAFISYPAGHETNKVRIQSNQSITGYAIIT